MTNTLHITNAYHNYLHTIQIPEIIDNVTLNGSVSGTLMHIAANNGIAYITYSSGEVVKVTPTGETAATFQAVGKSLQDIQALRNSQVTAGSLTTISCWTDPVAEVTYVLELHQDSTNTVLAYTLPHGAAAGTVQVLATLESRYDYYSTPHTYENLGTMCCGMLEVSEDPYGSQLPVKFIMWDPNIGFFISTITAMPNWVSDGNNHIQSLLVKSVSPFEAYLLILRWSGTPKHIAVYKLSGTKESPTVEEYNMHITPEAISISSTRSQIMRLVNLAKVAGEFELGISYAAPVSTTNPGNWIPWHPSGFVTRRTALIKVSDKQSVLDATDYDFEIKQYNNKGLKIDDEIVTYTEDNEGLVSIPNKVVTPLINRRGTDTILIYPNLSQKDSLFYSNPGV